MENKINYCYTGNICKSSPNFSSYNNYNMTQKCIDCVQTATFQKKYIILDLDIGIDDAISLIVMKKIIEHYSDTSHFLGIITSFGNNNICQTTYNTLKLCDLLGLNIPIIQGAQGPLNTNIQVSYPTNVHGMNGIGDVDIQCYSEHKLTNMLLYNIDPSAFIYDMTCRYPITYVVVGPLTNIAKAILQYPIISTMISEMIIMGGAFGFQGINGNVTPYSEANIHNDVDAANIVFEKMCNVHVIGLDTTHQFIADRDFFQSLVTNPPFLQPFVYDITEKYEKVYKSIDMNGMVLHDVLAVICAFNQNLFSFYYAPITLNTDSSSPYYGRTRLEHNTNPMIYKPHHYISYGVNPNIILSFLRDLFRM